MAMEICGIDEAGRGPIAGPLVVAGCIFKNEKLKVKSEKLNIDKLELSQSDKRLQFLQMLRDEAHRFAIEFHRKTKRKKDTQIDLLQVKGIGKAKMTKLLNYFGSFDNIKKASFDELKDVLNEKDAKAIKEFFKGQK